MQWWLAHLSATDWLTHTERLLKGAAELVRLLAGEGASVLVHCSDGWDRTPRGLSHIGVDLVGPVAHDPIS